MVGRLSPFLLGPGGFSGTRFNFQHYRKISPSLVVTERSRWNGLHSNLLKSSGRQTNTTNEIHNKNWNFESETKLKKEDNPSTIPITKGSTSSSRMINGPPKNRKTPASLHLPQGPMDGLDGLNVWKAREIKKLEKTPKKSACAFAWTNLCCLCIRYMYHPGNSLGELTYLS